MKVGIDYVVEMEVSDDNAAMETGVSFFKVENSPQN